MPTARGTPGRRQSDIARAAGVSRATVSMVLNGRTDKGAAISPATRERVLRVAGEMGYASNPAARSLAGGRNQLLGVFTFESIFPAESADFYHPFFLGVEREAEAQGYDLVLFTSAAGPDGQRSIYRNNVNRLRMADGCVLFGGDTDRFELDRLVQDDFPFVLIGRREVPGREIAYVRADYAEPTVEVVGRLAALGHRRVAYLGSGSQFEPVRERAEAYRRAQKLHDLDPDPRFRLTTAVSSLRFDEAQALLEDGVTAFVAESADLARRLLQLTEAAGLRPPRDFSLVGLVDPFDREPKPVEVAGLRLPRRDLGGLAVRMLVDMLGGAELEPRRQVALPCQVVTGDTMSKPQSRRRSGARRRKPTQEA